MKKIAILLIMTIALTSVLNAQEKFDGLHPNLSNLHRLSKAKTRSISPENFTGEKGKGGMAKIGEGTASFEASDLGLSWKVNPFVIIKPGETFVLADISGPGSVQHIWMTPTGNRRLSIIRFYWDDEQDPSVESPVGDFFANGWGSYAHVNSLPVTVNPGSAYNCYWPMPFRKKCKITMTNIDKVDMRLYYQVDYVLTDVPADAAYFHAQYRRVNPLPAKEVYTILDRVEGEGHYIGTYMAWQANSNGWLGEGEIKFYMDGDGEFPTICGTGLEDYFCGSYNFHIREANSSNRSIGSYVEYTTAYAGMPQVIRPDGDYQANMRFGLYRWHITDPIRFERELKVTIQALGWRDGDKYLPLKDDIASVAFWYQREPHVTFPDLPSKEELDVN